MVAAFDVQTDVVFRCHDHWQCILTPVFSPFLAHLTAALRNGGSETRIIEIARHGKSETCRASAWPSHSLRGSFCQRCSKRRRLVAHRRGRAISLRGSFCHGCSDVGNLPRISVPEPWQRPCLPAKY
jgi:hypothetical protein